MNSLDNPKQIKKLDPGNALGSIGMLGEQISQVWQEFKKVKIPAQYKKIDNIVINGMGGSGLPGHLLQSLYLTELKKPLQVINSYLVPDYVNSRTLYIISSYSGGTEEPVTSFGEAKKRGAKIFGITSGGKLARMIKQDRMPGVIFNTVANPSGQPRLGLGYNLGAHLALFRKLGLIKLSDGQIKELLKNITSFKKHSDFDNLFAKNKAKQLATEIQGKAIIIVGSEHLAGNAHVFANQTNETAKTLAFYHLIPELNHHFLESLKFPATNRSNLFFIFLESDLYHPKNQIRHRVTKDIVVKNKVKFYSYKLKAKNQLDQVFEALVFGSYATFYLAMLNNLNPNLIPWVDYFKAQLKKKS